MNLPSGLVFYLDFKYGSAQGGRSADTSMYGNVSGVNKIGEDVDPAGGLYGEGSYGYSSNFASSSLGAGSLNATIADGKFTTASVDLDSNPDEARFDFDLDFSASLAAAGYAANLFNVITIHSDQISGADLEGIRAFRLSSTNAGDIAEVYNRFTKVNASGHLEFLVRASSNTAIDANTELKVEYIKQPTDGTRGDFEDVPGSNLSIPEINVELKSEAIVAKTRKLKAQWTPEFAQDLNAYHSIDAEAELTSLLSEYISMEIDIEILDMLIKGAVTTEKWSALNNKHYENGVWGVRTIDNGGLYNSQGEWFQTLGTKIQKVSNKIHQKTLRGGANFIVVSPTVATVLESIPGYAASTDGDQAEFSFGVQRVGALNGRYKVYKNPYMIENTILVGFRGAQFLEAGAVYAPYIPLIMTPLVYDPSTFTPRKGVMTRYAKKMIRPEFYGKVFCSDLLTV
jgi:hypothetical protein